MKVASKGTLVYVVAFAILIFWAYFVQADTRRVDGTSMLPTLEGGDLVVIQQTSLGSVHVGDIIVYNGLCSAGGESVVHRVVAITSMGLITEGDANRGTDQALSIATGPITQQCLEGKVVFVIPYVELLAFYIDSHGLPQWYNYLPSALVLLIILAAIYLQGEEKEEQKPAEPTDAQA
jgi:signal peptidase I